MDDPSIDPIVAENTDKPVDFPEAAPEPVSEAPPMGEPAITDADIAAYQEEQAAKERELSELRQRALSQNVDPKDIAKAVAEAMKPTPPQPWETDDFIKDRHSLVNGMKAFYEHQTDSLRKELAEIKQVIPLLYARSQENPQFPMIQKAAGEMAQKYGVSYHTALQWAMDNVKAPAPQKAPPPIPQSARLPNTAPAPSNGKVRFTGDWSKLFEDIKGSGNW